MFTREWKCSWHTNDVVSLARFETRWRWDFYEKTTKLLIFHTHLLLVIKIEEDDIEQPENEMEEIEVWVLSF